MRDIANYRRTEIRAAAVLTNSYVNATVLTEAWRYNQCVLLIQTTLGSLTSIEVRVETSFDNTTWFQETFSQFNTATQSLEQVGDRTFTASGNYRIAFSVADNYIRVAIKGTGTVTSSSATIDAVLAR